MVLQSKSEVETQEIGRKLGRKLKRGDVVCFYGELGSGKTTMIKGVASAFEIDEREITSASFIIIAEHEGVMPFYHIDLYRIGQGQAGDIGLREYLHGDGVSVIEWAERDEDDIPDESIKIRMVHTGESSRTIEIEGVQFDMNA